MVVQPAEVFPMVVRAMGVLTWWVRLKVVGLWAVGQLKTSDQDVNQSTNLLQ